MTKLESKRKIKLKQVKQPLKQPLKQVKDVQLKEIKRFFKQALKQPLKPAKSHAFPRRDMSRIRCECGNTSKLGKELTKGYIVLEDDRGQLQKEYAAVKITVSKLLRCKPCGRVLYVSRGL